MLFFSEPRTATVPCTDLFSEPSEPCTEPCTAATVPTMTSSYWTAANDVAATSAPVNAVGQRRSTPPATGQRRRSTTVNGAGHRSMVVGGLVKVGHGPGLDRVWAGSGSSLAGSGSGLPRGMPRVSHVCPRGVHVDADVDNMH
uniref:Uncharacterized protein n=1 Tax=Tanacetum cinerariifolium TaxID=118510 RepID=A0A699QWM1_TANCI|nr:hypothetical protein [Tanacetum cinerariifolium]